MTAPSHASTSPTGPSEPASLGCESVSGLLTQIMPLMRLAVWEAWDDPLELIALQFGASDHPALPLEPSQAEPGAAWNENIYPGDRASVRAFLDAPESVRGASAVDYRLIVADGDLIWVRHWLLRRTPRSEGRSRLLGVLLPITEQKQLEAEYLRVGEQERNRIGQELHDDLGQVLGGMAFMIQALSRRAAKTAPVLSPDIEELNAQVAGVTERVRWMAHGLFPVRLQHATLSDALNDFAAQTRVRFPVCFALELPRQLPPHSPEQILHLYRIAQEAVSNAVRHGGATCIRLALKASPGWLKVDIEDDGRGFPATPMRPEGIGLPNMQYRARMLGGTIQFENLTPKGAGVYLQYPPPQAISPLNRKATQSP